MAAHAETVRPREALPIRRSIGEWLQRNAGQIPLYLVLTVALLVAIVPFIWVIFGSLKSSGEIFSSPFGFPRAWRFSNYETAWVDGHFGTYFFNNAIGPRLAWRSRRSVSARSRVAATP